jgi:hypothetical protein
MTTEDNPKDEDLIVLRRSEFPVLLQRLAALGAAQLDGVLARQPVPKATSKQTLEAEVAHLRAVVATKDREIGQLRAYIGPRRLAQAERRDEQVGMVNVFPRSSSKRRRR